MARRNAAGQWQPEARERGTDLFEANHGQCLLQVLMGLAVPRRHHHSLVLGANGRRLAKRDKGETLAMLRETGDDPLSLRAVLLARAINQ